MQEQCPVPGKICSPNQAQDHDSRPAGPPGGPAARPAALPPAAGRCSWQGSSNARRVFALVAVSPCRSSPSSSAHGSSSRCSPTLASQQRHPPSGQPALRRRPRWASSRSTSRQGRQCGRRSTRPVAKTPGTEPIRWDRDTEYPGAAEAEGSGPVCLFGEESAPGGRNPGLTPPLAPDPAPAALKPDDRRRLNRARSVRREAELCGCFSIRWWASWAASSAERRWRTPDARRWVSLRAARAVGRHPVPISGARTAASCRKG